jgi:hypothetical protein
VSTKAEAALLAVYLARRGRKVDAADADADADGDNKEDEVLEADTKVQKRRKTEDDVAAMKVAEDVRMESDSEPFWLAHVMVRLQKTEIKSMMNIMSKIMMEFMQNVSKMKKIIVTTTMKDPTPAEEVSVDGSSLQLPCNGFQDFDIISLIIQEIAKKVSIVTNEPFKSASS